MSKYVKDGYIFNTKPAKLVCKWHKPNVIGESKMKLFKGRNGYFIVDCDKKDIKTYTDNPNDYLLTSWLEKHVPDCEIIEHFEDKFFEF